MVPCDIKHTALRASAWACPLRVRPRIRLSLRSDAYRLRPKPTQACARCARAITSWSPTSTATATPGARLCTACLWVENEAGMAGQRTPAITCQLAEAGRGWRPPCAGGCVLRGRIGRSLWARLVRVRASTIFHRAACFQPLGTKSAVLAGCVQTSGGRRTAVGSAWCLPW